MRWGSPLSLLLLLAAVPLVLFLHSLKPQGAKVRTATMFLWERVLKERPVGKRLGWLFRNNLLLILQLLAVFALIGALAEPSLVRYGAPEGRTVAVVDLSASMNARGRSGSRFDAARRELLSYIDRLASAEGMVLIGAGPAPQLLLPYTTDKQRLKEFAKSLAPTDAPAPVKDAVLFAHSFLRQGSRDRVVVFSDAAFDGADTLDWLSPHLRLVRVEGGERNVGIVSFEFRRLPNSADKYEIMAGVKNFTSAPVGAPLTLTLGKRKLAEAILELPPYESRVLIHPYRGSLEERAEARLAIDDDFATDNRAFLVLSEPPAVRLLYVGKGNPFLEHLFASLPNVRVTRVERVAAELWSSQTHEHDVILLDGVPSPPITEGNFLLINTAGAGLPLDIQGKLLKPRVISEAVRHPLMAGIRLQDLYVKEALRLIPGRDGIGLANSAEGPLILALEKGRLKVLIVGFDLSASDLPLKVAFPVLFSNALDWFYPTRVEFPAAQVQAGRPYALYLPGTDDQVEVKTPAGGKETLKVISRPLPFADTLHSGFYTFKSKGREGQFAVNLFSESESQIAPRVTLPSKSLTDVKEQGGVEESGLSLWTFLIVAVLILLCVEGFLVFRGLRESFYPLAFHAAALAALLLALINPRMFRAPSGLDVILAADFSRSVGQAGVERAVEVLDKARQIQAPNARTGLLFFGRQPAWEFFPRRDFSPADFSPSVDREETDLQSALQAALAQIGEGREGRVLLVSDGNENRGEVSRALPLLRARGVPAWILPVNLSQGRNEVYVSDLNLPSQVDSSESFAVRGAVESLRQAPARVKLLRDGIIRREREITLKPGTNWVAFPESLTERGMHSYELLAETAEDTLAENNLLQGVVDVRGPPRVLYLRSPEGAQRLFPRALAAQGYTVVESTPEQASLALPELSTFDLLVIENIPAFRLSQSKMESIERYVRDLGGGMVVIGGPQSYGAGGYYRTPLERVLPVEMRPPSRLDVPHVALLFVLDKSGSMAAGPQGATKLDLAKAAAFAAADLLNPSDQIGILTFDAGWDWLLPFRRVGKGELISEKLSSVQSDGGTDLYKAMVEAHRAFRAKQAAIKHLLVLSDGLTDKADFHALVERMAQEGITVSTVAIGQDADFALMAGIAKDGKGRGYATVDPQTIPQIFTTETLLISRDLLVEKPVQPRAVATVGALKGFSQKKIPPLRGYVVTHPKPQAELMMGVEKDPLLVSWRYGLGQVAAFTSDLGGRWGREWATWEEFPQWAGQLARSVVRKVSDHKARSEFQQEGKEVRAVVDFLSKDGAFVNGLRLRGSLTGPDQKTMAAEFRQIAPGRYESRFSAPQRGIYLLTVSQELEKEAPVAAGTFPFVAPYPREYRELKANTALLSRVAEESGGEILEPDQLDDGLKRLFTPDPNKAQAARETWWPLSGLGLGLFLTGLALRRLPALFGERRASLPTHRDPL